jgi:hypothetical protein
VDALVSGLQAPEDYRTDPFGGSFGAPADSSRRLHGGHARSMPVTSSAPLPSDTTLDRVGEGSGRAGELGRTTRRRGRRVRAGPGISDEALPDWVTAERRERARRDHCRRADGAGAEAEVARPRKGPMQGPAATADRLTAFHNVCLCLPR